MSIELHKEIVTVPVAKELKKDGYIQEGLWWYFPYYSKNGKVLVWDIAHRNGSSPEGTLAISAQQLQDAIVAPTVTELGKALSIYGKDWASSPNITHVSGIGDFSGATEADSRARAWLYLEGRKK